MLFRVPAGQFPHSGLGRVRTAFSMRSGVPFLLEGGNLLAGFGIVLAELSVVPADEQPQHGAVALEDAFSDFLDADGLVLSLHWPVPRPAGFRGTRLSH